MDFDLVYLSLGSNIGDKLLNIEKAIDAISLLTGTPFFKSSIYITEPWGYSDQEEFLNQVIAIRTKLEAKHLLEELLEIEMSLGRIRTVRNAPRIIDIDILLYKGLIIKQENIVIPHPRMQLRKFILIPMNEIAPNLIHPVLNLSMKELLATCVDNSSVKKLEHYEIKSK